MTRSACPAWPASYVGRFFDPATWASTKSTATRSSQPKTAILRCLADQPAARSVRLVRGPADRWPGSPPAEGGPNVGGAGDTGLRGERMTTPSLLLAWCEVSHVRDSRG